MGIDPTILFQSRKKVAGNDAIIMELYEILTLHEKCPNMEFFLVRISLYCVQILCVVGHFLRSGTLTNFNNMALMF